MRRILFELEKKSNKDTKLDRSYTIIHFNRTLYIFIENNKIFDVQCLSRRRRDKFFLGGKYIILYSPLIN